ncbi:MAG: hypothetical protein KA956_01020 [Pyrinomonadaceae bacterium]|nr:hypothetical protein [Acidobacteriota bacterium]MBP7375035.1 hypothetical protein [Pyrinomonadaceae bacterium]
MVNRNETNTARPNDRNLTTSNKLEHFPAQRSKNIDDVIYSLANRPENRRARQVTEWERLRHQTFRAAA